MSGSSATTSSASTSPNPGRGVMRTLRCSISAPDISQGQSPSAGIDSDSPPVARTKYGSQPTCSLLEDDRELGVTGEHTAEEHRMRRDSAT